MAEEEVLQERVWREYEIDFMLRWFYRICKSWEPVSSRAILTVVTRFRQVLHNQYPRVPPRSRVEIVQKLMALRSEFVEFGWFINLFGVRYQDQWNSVQTGITYWERTGLQEPRLHWRFRKYGIRQYEARKFLFDGGCLDNIDYRWLMDAAAGVEKAWLGEPYA